jgi:drug/metabolite transporter (DMT)-like permease
MIMRYGIDATFVLGMILTVSGTLVVGFKSHWKLFQPAPPDANAGMMLTVAGAVLVCIAYVMAEYVSWRWDRR